MIEFLTLIIDKTLWAGFAFSVLFALYYLVRFLANAFKNPPQQLVLSHKEKIAIGVTVAFIIMSIFTGIKL